MAIIVDPDSLDRNQVIFGTSNRKISISPVGTLRHASTTGSNGATTSGSAIFTSTSKTFTTWGVIPGDVLDVYTKDDAGHYEIKLVPSETTLEILTGSEFTGFTVTNTSIVYDIRKALSGSAVDGVTEQALYSFGKEEWKTDSAVYGGDDLIRHEFPWEPITSEQFEVGGGSSHDNWEMFNDYTRKKVRTGGWEKKNTASTSINKWTGIVTLGSLDTDTQAYYQQSGSSADPTDFTFLGTVNEPIKIWESGWDRTTYLKLFARKKGKSYAGASISDIGVTTIQTIVNRFPLAHSNDPAIVASDGQVLGYTTWRGQRSLATGSNGATAADSTFTSVGSDFVTAGVVAGDCLHITGGTWDGYWTITNVAATILTVDASEFGPWTVTTNNVFDVTSTYKIRGKTDGVIANQSGTIGSITSAGSDFTGSAVAINDLVVITEPASDYRGVYKVTSIDSPTRLGVNTTDKQFGSVSSVDFDVVKPGMYLQYKRDALTLGATTTLTFSAGARTIVRAAGDWASDGVTAGSIVTITNSVSNNKSFTVLTAVTNTITCVATDVLVDEGPVAATATAFNPFKRTINGVVYGFSWKVLGNGALAADVYQFLQHQLRQSSDINWGPDVSRGDVTNLLMSFQAPNGVTTDMHIDDIHADDTNNVTYYDATGIARTYPYVAAGSILFNQNLQDDAAAEYVMFFTNDNAGDNTGRDYGTINAIIVKNAALADISGSVGGAPSVQFTYDYDGNVQRGAASAGVNAPVTIVAIGLTKAQFVITTGEITRAKGINFSLVSNLERNYSNP